MKNLKTIIPAVMIILGTVQAKTPKYNDDRLTVNYAINIYVGALSYGHIKGLSELFDDNLKYTSVYGKNTMLLSKVDVMNYFKDNEGVEQNCLVTTITEDKTPDVTILKVYMKYDSFTRLNYVTMVNSNRGWKITNVYSTVQQKNDKNNFQQKSRFKQR